MCPREANATSWRERGGEPASRLRSKRPSAGLEWGALLGKGGRRKGLTVKGVA